MNLEGLRGLYAYAQKLMYMSHTQSRWYKHEKADYHSVMHSFTHQAFTDDLLFRNLSVCPQEKEPSPDATPCLSKLVSGAIVTKVAEPGLNQLSHSSQLLHHPPQNPHVDPTATLSQ